MVRKGLWARLSGQGLKGLHESCCDERELQKRRVRPEQGDEEDSSDVGSKVTVTWPWRAAVGMEVNEVSTVPRRACTGDGVTTVLGAGWLCFTSILHPHRNAPGEVPWATTRQKAGGALQPSPVGRA